MTEKVCIDALETLLPYAYAQQYASGKATANFWKGSLDVANLLKEGTLKVGDVIRATNVAQVVESNHPNYTPGELATAGFGWQEYAVSIGEPTNMGPIRPVPKGVPPSLVLGAPAATGVAAAQAVKPGSLVFFFPRNGAHRKGSKKPGTAGQHPSRSFGHHQV